MGEDYRDLEPLPENPVPTRRTTASARRTYDLERTVARHAEWFSELHVADMSKPEREALPLVLRAWTFNAEVAAAGRRKLAVIVGASSAAATVLALTVDLVTRYVWPVH